MPIKGGISALRSAAGCVAIASAFFFAAPVHSQMRPAQPVRFDIPAGSLQSALTVFARQAGVQLIYAPEAVAGRKVAPMHVSLTARAALERLLANSGLRIREVNAKVVVLERDSARSDVGNDAAALAAAERQAGESAVLQLGSDQPPQQEIVVTGTNIRGEPPVGSNVRTIDRKEIERNGYSSVGQVLQALPGNFGGVATEQSALSFVDHTGTNATLATGVNLRGLGADATLVLVNGHRIAGSGLLGDFSDVSTIPLSLVDRIEVLMDGASAIYGSDAVGGVVNIILKDRFKGLETGARFGTVTKGGMRELEAYQIAGTEWGTGSALFSYEFYNRTALHASDRRFSRSADSRPLGGTDHRSIASVPGNILGFDPITGALEVTYAVPPGQNGTALTPSDFLPGVTNYGDTELGAWLTPDQTRHSLYARATQDLSPAVRLAVDGRYGRRTFKSQASGYLTAFAITDANPWFVSPDGGSSDLMGYAFDNDLGPTRTSGSVDAMAFTAALDADLPRQWHLNAYGAYAQEIDHSRTDNIANEAILQEALGNVPDDPATSYNPARDGYFNPYGDGTANAPAVLSAIRGYQSSRYINRITTANVQVDGPLFDLPGGAVRAAVGANIRHESFAGSLVDFYMSDTPQTTATGDYSRTIKAAFGELRLPVVGPDNAIPGLRRLELSAAGRVEWYPDFGSTANPKIGIDWSPVGGLTIRSTYGTSFRAPNLSELRSASTGTPVIISNPSGGSSVVVELAGGNPDLKPERARSWTLGAELKPVAGLRLNATLFRTLFDRRIDRPVLNNFSQALTDPDLIPFVERVSPATNPSDYDKVAALLSGSPTSVAIDSVSAIVDARYVNTAETEVRGIDFTIGYSTKVGADTLSIDANGTYLLAWRQRTTPTSAAIDMRNRAGEPVDFRGRVTAAWHHDHFDGLIGLNYVNPYRDAVTGARIHAWTTVDARIAWTAPKHSVIGDVTFALIAQNLFDEDPPFYDSSAGVGYDAANADATGRFVSFQITKRW